MQPRHVTAGRAAGFTLIEMTIVVAIILLIASISLPNFLATRQAAYEAAAAALLRTVHSAQETYRVPNQQYTDQFAALAVEGEPGSGGKGKCKGKSKGKGKGKGKGGCEVLIKLGYIFTLESPSEDEWNVVGEPIRNRSSSRFFYADDTGAIHTTHGKFADNTSPLL